MQDHKKLLFYYPSNKRSNVLETILLEFNKRGVDFEVLTTCEKGDFHYYLEGNGIKTSSHVVVKNNAAVYYLKQIYFLIKFCNKNKISIIHSHLQHTNFIAVIAQFFIKANVVIFRHQFRFNVYSDDKTNLSNKNEVLLDRIINFLAKKIIVPSKGVYDGIIQFENIKKEKLFIIPYVYDFSKYIKPNIDHARSLALKYPAHIKLLMCSRLVKFKRHYIVLPIIKKLIDEGNDICLLILDEGPEEETIKKYIEDNNLQEKVFLLGFRKDFMDYMSICDLLIHPSLSEASNSTAKEMGLLNKTIAVCEKVGDFDEYVINDVNGFLMSPNNTQGELERILREIIINKGRLEKMGNKLHETVLQKFDRSDKILEEYIKLI